MRTIYALVLLGLNFAYAQDINIEELAKRIDNLESSTKLSKNLDYKVYDPFATAKPILKQSQIIKKKYHQKILLQTILNDKVFIQNRWYTKGDAIQGYKIKQIFKNSVLLCKNNKCKKTYQKTSKNLLTIEDK